MQEQVPYNKPSLKWQEEAIMSGVLSIDIGAWRGAGGLRTPPYDAHHWLQSVLTSPEAVDEYGEGFRSLSGLAVLTAQSIPNAGHCHFGRYRAFMTPVIQSTAEDYYILPLKDGH